ncbi:hypothetical protein RGB72_06800 [Glutamicibacter protophormiae]|uniref:DUF304 domain-containing protein n=2 Tax=Kocuria TaxID=57493 RepID=A0A7D7Q3X9_KOCVA|nr:MULTISPECIES: hypothetical protein [Kocuria]MDN5632212.1 hypothetical protein [Kocuria sp.]QMS56698.1 hypothetical protein CIB50_0001412 [Kocuria varians]RUP83545.1 hypothetical protein D8M39_07290 [Kocuria sp. HSID17590]WNB87721.1 hypothetical protein RGB72_06800 [Glutamicibacter protophormiae]
MSRSGTLALAPGEETVVATRAHPLKLVGPALAAWLIVLCYSALSRVLDLTWRPTDTPWTTVHTFVGWVLALAALLAAWRFVVAPVWRWLRTRFVLTTRRLALVGPPVRNGEVALPLEALRSVRVTRGATTPGEAREGLDRGTVLADFGHLGGLKLSGCPQPARFAQLVRESAAGASNSWA